VTGISSLFVVGALCAITAIGCGDSSGCESFDPDSPDFNSGKSQVVEVQITDERRWPTVDAGGRYWVTDAPVPPSAAAGEEFEATATLIDENTLNVDIGTSEVTFTGPISCE